MLQAGKRKTAEERVVCEKRARGQDDKRSPSVDQLHEARVFRTLESFVHNYGFASHQWESYEYFVHHLLPDIIRELSPVTVVNPEHRTMHRVFLENVYFKRPTTMQANGFWRPLFPHEAHMRKQSYVFDVVVNVRHKVYQGAPPASPGEPWKMRLMRHVLYRDLAFTRIPCMVGSSLCYTHQNMDLPPRERGAFIINGFEKTLITQGQLRCNYPYRTKHPVKQCRSATNDVNWVLIKSKCMTPSCFSTGQKQTFHVRKDRERNRTGVANGAGRKRALPSLAR